MDAAQIHPTKIETKQEAKTLSKEQVKTVALKQCKGTVKSIQLKKEKGVDVFYVLIKGMDGKTTM
ncbi:hypothetical protein [Laceyella putida]|uniref:PepSY domain-containing protein n=1 Tax=Laceyella putida TaxID=110101 RepID=A0ABW2RJA3_9BACL